jgi:hypothetical protein
VIVQGDMLSRLVKDTRMSGIFSKSCCMALLTNGLSDRFALTGPYLCLTKVSDDLLCGVTLSRHAIPFARSQILTLEMETFQGGRHSRTECATFVLARTTRSRTER